jgi:hypothetical protein
MTQTSRSSKRHATHTTRSAIAHLAVVSPAPDVESLPQQGPGRQETDGPHSKKAARQKAKVIVIRMNTNSERTPCAICGEEFDPFCGPELATDDGLVCIECGKKHESALGYLIEMARWADEYAFFHQSWQERTSLAA